MLEARSLTVKVGATALITSIDIDIAPGQLTAILGPNGAGKSTLFHALAGGVRPTHNQVWLDGRPLADWPRAVLARRRAVLGQHPTLGFDFGVREVVELGRIPHPRDAQRDAHIAEQTLAEVGLAAFADRRYLTLSGGERQRVHVARTLAQVWDTRPDQRVLMLDEPATHLDITHAKVVLDALRGLARAGACVLVVLHELNLASAYADRLVLLAHGRIVAQGAPRDVLRPDTLACAYGAGVTVIAHPEDGRPIVL